MRAKSTPLSGGLTFVAAQPKTEKPGREKQPTVRNDPKFVAAARELRDRWLERVNENPLSIQGAGKYNLACGIGERVTIEAGPAEQVKLIAA
jgi:hypothetical protein